MFVGHRILVIFVMAVFFTFFSPEAAAKAKKNDDKKTDGAGTLQSAKSPVNDQEFWYYVPNSVKGKKKVPFVLSYHGAMGRGDGEIKQWMKFADEHSFIVACPTSDFAGANTKAGTPLHVPPGSFVKEIATILSIVDFMQAKFDIDRRYRMITGFSGGGIPTYWFGMTHPHIFRFVCPRSANFPPILVTAHQEHPQLKKLFDTGEIKKNIDTAARESYIYVFWGSEDHQIILQSIQQIIAWLKSLEPAHLKFEKIEGMKHQSRADLAVKWFVETMAEAAKRFEAEAKELYPGLIAGATADEKNEDFGAAREKYKKAVELEEDYPKLGRGSERKLKKIEDDAKRLLSRVKSLRKTKKEEAALILQDVLNKYRGTAAAEEGKDLLPELPPPPAPEADTAADAPAGDTVPNAPGA